jgi:hypothetical protein
MKGSLPTLLFLIIFGCSNSQENEIRLFDNLIFNYNSSETPTSPSQEEQERYKRLFNSGTVQIPLFKHIQGKNYEVFVGLPYQTSLKKLANSRILETPSNKQNFNEDSLYYFNKYEKNGSYIAEYATKRKNDHIFFVSIISTSEEINDSLYTKDLIAKRISNGS